MVVLRGTMGGGGVSPKADTDGTPLVGFSLVEKNWTEPDKKLISKFDVCTNEIYISLESQLVHCLRNPI